MRSTTHLSVTSSWSALWGVVLPVLEQHFVHILGPLPSRWCRELSRAIGDGGVVTDVVRRPGSIGKCDELFEAGRSSRKSGSESLWRRVIKDELTFLSL